MCITNSWKYINADKNSNIYAQRSDGLFIQLFPEEFDSIANFVLKLEEFRNCKCTPEAPCFNHVNEKERIS